MEDENSSAITFNELIDLIALFLPLKDLCSLLSVNGTYYNTLTRDGFWRRKLEFDYHVTVKRSNQTWFERYKLAYSMGSIYVLNLCNYPPVEFNIGEKLNIEGLPDGNNHLLPYKAISAILIRPCLYYINDEYELYIVGESGYDRNACKIPELLDTNVTFLGGGPYDFFYIKEGDIYHCIRSMKKRITSRGDIIELSFCHPFISYITNDNVLYQMIYEENGNDMLNAIEFKPYKQAESNVVKVVQFGNKHLFLDKNGKLQTRNTLLMETINSNPLLHHVINIYGDYLFLNNKDELITISSREENLVDDVNDDQGESYENTHEVINYNFTYEFNGIKDVVAASSSYISSIESYLKMIRTRNGDIFVSTEDDKGVKKLGIITKDLCYSPENIILII
jgi:hypothetical protein